MKKPLILCLLLVFAGSTNAQSESLEKNKKLKLTSIGIELGIMNDRYSKMDLESMYDLTKNPALLDRDLTGYDGTLYRTSEGSRLGINASFTPFSSADGAYRTNHEVRFGAFYSSREPLVSYNRTEEDGAYNTIIYCNMVNEFSAHGSYIIRKSPAGAKWFSVYAGLGASIGSSVKNQVVVMEFENDGDQSTEATNVNSFYKGKSSLFTRIYAPIGFDITVLNRVRLGLDANLGVGMQNVYGGKTYTMPFGVAVSTKLAWVF